MIKAPLGMIFQMKMSALSSRNEIDTIEVLLAISACQHNAEQVDPASFWQPVQPLIKGNLLVL